MTIRWNQAYLTGHLWGLKGNTQDISNLIKTIINEYKSQSKNSQEIVRAAVKKYATKNGTTELDVYNCLEKARKKLAGIAGPKPRKF